MDKIFLIIYLYFFYNLYYSFCDLALNKNFKNKQIKTNFFRMITLIFIGDFIFSQNFNIISFLKNIGLMLLTQIFLILMLLIFNISLQYIKKIVKEKK